MTRDVGLGCDCVVVSDPHEDDANIHVPTFDRAGESGLHIMLENRGEGVPVMQNTPRIMVPDHSKTF